MSRFTVRLELDFLRETTEDFLPLAKHSPGNPEILPRGHCLI